jgi:hypothetical protein
LWLIALLSVCEYVVVLEAKVVEVDMMFGAEEGQPQPMLV